MSATPLHAQILICDPPTHAAPFRRFCRHGPKKTKKHIKSKDATSIELKMPALIEYLYAHDVFLRHSTTVRFLVKQRNCNEAPRSMISNVTYSAYGLTYRFPKSFRDFSLQWLPASRILGCVKLPVFFHKASHFCCACLHPECVCHIVTQSVSVILTADTGFKFTCRMCISDIREPGMKINLSEKCVSRRVLKRSVKILHLLDTKLKMAVSQQDNLPRRRLVAFHRAAGSRETPGTAIGLAAGKGLHMVDHGRR